MMNSSYRFIEHRVIALSNRLEYQPTDSWPFVQKQALSWKTGPLQICHISDFKNYLLIIINTLQWTVKRIHKICYTTKKGTRLKLPSLHYSGYARLII